MKPLYSSLLIGSALTLTACIDNPFEINAGADINADMKTQVTLTATGDTQSTDLQWQQVAGPAATVVAQDGASYTIETPLITQASGATLTFEVTVTAANGRQLKDQVNVDVNLTAPFAVPDYKADATPFNLTETRFEISQALSTVSFQHNGNSAGSISFDVGFGSGAYHYPNDPEHVFYTISDRGPNIKCEDSEDIIGVADFCGADNEDNKIFPVPAFAPVIARMELIQGANGPEAQIAEVITLRDKDGQPISGITNPLTVTDTELSFSHTGEQLAFDAQGVDPEALVKLNDGSFWIAEEYGPSLLHVAANGIILQRVVPAGMEQDLADANYPVTGSLPAILAKRKLNRGAESIAITPDNQFLYFIMQSPLANPDTDAYANSRNVRLVKLSLANDGSLDSVIGEYVYRMDVPQTFANKAAESGDLKNGDYRKQKDVKISEMVAIGEDDLIILERISKVTKLYRVNLQHADNILSSQFDSQSTSLRPLESTADLSEITATPVTKELVYNSLTAAGTGLPKKVEGLAMLNNEHLLLINDNDFGIEGDKTEIVILPIVDAISSGNAPQKIALTQVGRYDSGIFDEGAAEIVAFDSQQKKLFVVNANDASVDVLDISNPASPTKLTSITASSAGPDLGSANSVSVYNGTLAVAIEADTKQDPGLIAFYSTTDYSLLATVAVGALPDMVTFTHDGSKVLVANEGEPNDDYDNDPEGSISIIDVSNGVANATVNHLRFTDFNEGNSRADELPANVRIFGANASVAQDLEPEYIALSADSSKAYVSLQENNALAIIDVNNQTIDSIVGLGVKDYSVAGNEIDVSDKDDQINLKTWDNLVGMYQPDAIATYSWNNQSVVISANEGDARDYDGYSEEVRGDDLTLSPIHFASDAADSNNLGRIKTTTANGDSNNDGMVESIYSYGARSFSLWDQNGQQIFDSNSEFEKLLSERYPENFNASNDKNSHENRSDDKGAEPEGVATGQVGDRVYAFIGLERQGGIMVYDVTNPYGPQFVEYISNRDFSVKPGEGSDAGDLGPEGMLFIPADKSPSNQPLLVIGNEVSGTTTLYTINVL
ncbi:choice-of-anchor I family protein [Pleionea sp. CnH1-48]|uniref:choice-of-anchor I family protein n=1 Tax=Pleionea sp. CnH1-48 TaxID=2954494 RepID=UPI002097C109|nr:choice-of-anchor I family protein [Pleionea sp. CnH1-48]MCO7226467.1 choice-of-anchor I family protein [Pleionea sp. CnH1-48]